MEASKFGFGSMPPAFKFDPTDGDIVAYYLLPRVLGLPNPYAHAVVDCDPASAPPSELLEMYGNGQTVDHAFFYASTGGGRNKSRTIAGGGGVWQGQKGTEHTVTLLSPAGAEVKITYKKYSLSYYHRKGGRSTGFVMHEYVITNPKLPGKVLSRIKRKRATAAGAAAAADDQQAVLPDPEQPGTSYGYEAAGMASIGDGFGDPQAGDLYYGGDMADAGYYYSPLSHDVPLGEYNDYCSFPVADQPAAAAMKSEIQGFAGAQADAFYGGGMAEANGAYYDPSQFVPVADGEYNYYYDPNQYYVEEDVVEQQAGALGGYAEDAAVMCSGGEGLSSEQQAGALGGYAGDAAVMCSDNEPFSIEEQDGYAEDVAVMCSDNEWFSGEQQADALGGYAAYAEDAAVMCSGGEGLSDEEQAAALGGYAEGVAVTCSDNERFSGEQQAGAPGDYAEDAAVMCSDNEWLSIEEQAGDLGAYTEDAAVMCSGGEGLSGDGEQQAGAPCGYSDNGSVMRTESAHSTILFCDGCEELNGDEVYELLFGGNDGDFNFDEIVAGDAATVESGLVV